MKEDTRIIKRLRRNILSSKEVLRETEAVGIFGSLARGDFAERSDIDIFIVLREEDFVRQRDPHMLWYRRMRELTKELNREITVLIYTPESLREICNWYVLRLASEGVVIFDKGNIARLLEEIVEVAKEAGLEERELKGYKYWYAKDLKLGDVLELRVKDE